MNYIYFYSIQQIFKLFAELEKEGTGLVDIDKTWDVLKTIKTASGDFIPDESLLMIIKTAAGEEERSVDIRKFISVYCRVKQHKGAPA